MCIRATHHQDLIADHTLVAGKDIRGQIGSSNMADMLLTIGIRPSNSNKDFPGLTHAFLLLLSGNL